MTVPEPAESKTSQRTFRQSSAIWSAGLVLAVAGLFAITGLINVGSDGIEPVLWPAAVLLLCWAAFLRPCVRLGATGVAIRNMVRDSHLTWAAIDRVETRWALALVSREGREFKSWAITAQRPKRGAPDGGDVKGRAAASIKLADPENLSHRAGSAGAVGRQITDIVTQYEHGVAKGHVEEVEAKVSVRPAYDGIAAVLVALVCVLTALVL